MSLFGRNMREKEKIIREINTIEVEILGRREKELF
jgi:hypothetical protein